MNKELPKHIEEAIEKEAVKRYPKRYKNNAFRRTAFKEGSELMYSLLSASTEQGTVEERAKEWAKWYANKGSYQDWLKLPTSPFGTEGDFAKTLRVAKAGYLAGFKDGASSTPPSVQGLGEWQLCPKCNGDGNLARYNSPNLTNNACPVCDVCNGEKIITKPFLPNQSVSVQELIKKWEKEPFMFSLVKDLVKDFLSDLKSLQSQIK